MENTATGKILTVPVYAIIKAGAKTTINFEEVFSGLYELYSKPYFTTTQMESISTKTRTLLITVNIFLSFFLKNTKF